ncbi:unnamed protein product [Prorocentrum cordatum]|uniref:DNA (cytosine-5-)-methyltransferase n=1 Tax=Prorocentrum cordatum TaxID=2364126 RepID=A0ABN9VYJ1_9DINO|nr:unnamed protein product [Polarella glacialis]
MLVAGPSCVPFAATGNRLAWDDERSSTFTATTDCVIDQANRKGSKFVAFVIENVSGLGDKPKGKRKSPLDEVLEGLHNGLKGWVIVAWKLNSCEFGVPQTRPRYYICGRKASAFEVPFPSHSPADFKIKGLSLKQILDPGLPSNLRQLTPKMKSNLAYYRREARKWASPGTIAACDVCRDPAKVRSPVLRVDGTVPTLTTKNHSLYVFEVGGTRFERFISNEERAVLQGFSPQVVANLPNPRKALGNAMTVPVVGLVMACVLSGMKR